MTRNFNELIGGEELSSELSDARRLFQPTACPIFGEVILQRSLIACALRLFLASQ